MKKHECPRCGMKRLAKDFPNGHLGNGDWRRKKICKRCVSIRSLCNKYKITEEEYHQLFSDHEGRCAICKQPCPSGKSLAIDHDHVTGRVRGLLCINCNKGLGHFKDDVGLLQEAIDYLDC